MSDYFDRFCLLTCYVGRYEMRSSGFHEEVRRHNELLRRRPSWQAMLDYRTELERASSRYRRSLTPHDEALPAANDDDDETATVAGSLPGAYPTGYK